MSGTGKTAGIVRRWDRVDGLRMHARALGSPSSPPLVLVHGLGISGRYMVPLMRLLADDHYVLAPDLPGIGASDRPRAPLDVAGLADALAAWTETVGLHRPALLGHSLGCQVVAHVADRYPDRASRLVLAGPGRDPAARSPVRQALRLVADAPREAPSLIPLAVTDYLRSGPWRMWRTLRASLETDAADRLRRIPHPTLVVRGSRDPIASPDWARTIADLLPAGAAVQLDGAPHAVNYTTPAALAGIVRPFLAGGVEGPY
ncbi:alpha/beta fold hydrolase [Actinomadura hibisca]|uniref:alpha/beta fold hydrolase n=1 Tax=Actinomadura hibisca TaxID=68565 RepID=UPI0008305603|nr:alpha/beta fold hydrolase [Actinomadura hibisca]